MRHDGKIEFGSRLKDFFQRFFAIDEHISR